MAQSTVEHSKRDVVYLTEKAPIRVLHVDDEAGFLKAAKPCLEMQGAFQVDTALSVEEAMERMKKKKFDVIVSDYVMPEKNGLGFLKELRDSGNNIPFIIFTGKGREEVAIKALNLGADQYLNKVGHPEAVYGELAYGIHRCVERKRAENMLRDSEEKYRNLFENAMDVTLTLDLKGKITSINKAAVEYGFKPDEIVGRNMLKFFSKKYWPGLLKALSKVARGKPVEDEFEINTPKGKRTVKYRTNPIIIGNKVVGVQAILSDITERKRAEEELRRSREEYVAVMNLTGDIIVRVDKEGRWTFLNDGACKFWGKPREKLLGIEFADYLHPDDAEKTTATVQEMIKTKQIVEGMTNRQKTPKGWRTVEWNSVPVFDEAGNYAGMQATGRDITERKQAEEELRSSEKRLNILFEFAPDAYYLNDLKGNFIDGNKAAEELTGYNRSELIGKSFLKLKLLPRRQILKAAKLLAKNAFGKPTGPDEFVLKRKDGTPVPVEIRTFPVKIKGQTLVLGIARDITERKKAEKELNMTLEKLKILNDKLGVVGKLTRHDARNKLSAVTMNVFLAKQKLAGDHEALKHLSQIESACGQVERIFEFARIYEKLGAEELVYMDVEKIVGEAVMLFSDLHGVEVVNDCRGLTVLADSLLRQLLYNLIDNSLKHGKKVSQIRVHYEEMGKNQLKLIYEDDGIGIPRAEKEKIFKEGYGEGSGYGLYLIRKMSEVYGWTIRETGKQGKGARFTITIPKMGKNGKENYRLLKNLDS